MVVEPLSIPHCDKPEYAFIGNESIATLKRMCFEHLKSQVDGEGEDLLDSSIELEHCTLWADGDKLVADDISVYEVCYSHFEGRFDPMCDEIFFAMTIDKSESFVLSSFFDMFIVCVIMVITVLYRTRLCFTVLYLTSSIFLS